MKIKGWKTLLAGGLMIAYGIGGASLGIHGWDEGMNRAMEGLGLIGIGSKIDKLGGL
jgi:hypothetical protein